MELNCPKVNHLKKIKYRFTKESHVHFDELINECALNCEVNEIEHFSLVNQMSLLSFIPLNTIQIWWSVQFHINTLYA